MRIIPVIDLMGGIVVRGIGGRRNEYRPIVSQIAADAEPVTVAQAFLDLGYNEVYVADLDAIAGASPAISIYEQLQQMGLRLWIDAGLKSQQEAKNIVKGFAGHQSDHRIILGLESIGHTALFDDILQAIGREHFAFSLDLKHGQPITDIRTWRDKNPLSLVEELLGLACSG